MSRLQIIIVITGVIFILFALDLYQRKKFTLLHFLVFGGGTGAILFFSQFPGSLDDVGGLFGLARGADLIVYLSIIFLGYGYIESINSHTKQSNLITNLVSSSAVEAAGVPLAQTPPTHKQIGFLIRAYNEQDTIAQVIQEILQSGYSTIIVCNDGSTDNTRAILQQLIDTYSDNDQIHLVGLHHAINRGPGAANKTLFSYVRRYNSLVSMKWRITYDADGQMNIQDMQKFEMNMKDGIDVIVGSRNVSGGKSKGIPLTRSLILKLSKIFTYITIGEYYTDPHNGFRALRTEIISQLHLLSDSMTYASELLGEFTRLDAKIREVPVTITYTSASLAKGQKNSNAIKIVGELLYKRWFYK